jgi:RNA polymerase sigma-70 factor (ECF subfamily)
MRLKLTSGKASQHPGTNTAEALYNRHAPGLLSLCMRYCGKLEDAEDVLHDGFIKIIQKIDTFKQREEGSLEGWMKRIMVNTALNHLRDHSKEKMFVDIEPMVERLNEPDDEHWLENLAGKMTVEEVMGLLLELPSGYRTVFNLYAIESYSHKEIAGMLSISENTSKSQLSKARVMLKKKIHERISTQEVQYG